MDKKIIITLVIVGVIVVGAGAWLLAKYGLGSTTMLGGGQKTFQEQGGGSCNSGTCSDGTSCSYSCHKGETPVCNCNGKQAVCPNLIDQLACCDCKK